MLYAAKYQGVGFDLKFSINVQMEVITWIPDLCLFPNTNFQLEFLAIYI